MSFEFNPFTGKFDIVSSGSGTTTPDNFSIKKVISTTAIPSNQEMIVTDIEIDAEFDVEGQVVIDPIETPQDNFAYSEITKRVNIPEHQQMIVDADLIIENELQIDGYCLLEEVGNVINFSFKEIVTSLAIPAHQQMIADGELLLDNDLILEGEVSILTGIDDEFVPWYEIPTGKVINIKQYREYFISDDIILDGVIEVEGRLVIGA